MQEKNFWSTPWSYKQGLLIAFTLPVIGLLLEFVLRGEPISIPSFPYNAIILGVYLLIIALLSWFKRDSTLVKFLSTIPASVSAIVVFTLIVLLMGIIPQINSTQNWINVLGLNHILHNMMFMFSFVYLVTILSFTTFKKIVPFRLRNISFILNHAGLLIVLTGGVLGTADMYRLKMICTYNTPVWFGTDKDGKQFELPLALELQQFDIEYYEPEIVLLDNKTEEVLKISPKPDAFVEKNKTILLNSEYSVIVDTFYRHSFESNQKFYPVESIGSTHAAKIRVFHPKTKKEITKGWISAGSFLQNPRYLRNDEVTFALGAPKPKKYSSVFKLYSPNKEPHMVTLEVNKPIKCNGWKLYQVSYDDQKGRWSEYSVVEAIKDPWLPFVYIGFILLIVGSVFLIWQGQKTRKNG
ncbi:MAG: hypothetical protein CVU02_00830 [Bacteroidetes bacterium HGW-Bacteroidetes-19]|nr:MAG: hypothetical protein CVU04_05735 [Bacteroidetes bacterium HGW-Bacteroidetes-20]PKP28470.1 MAG: hypothetical protein CVU02_00830 [Bacteroidetes bacterium HGW-Bacteroidetes-19]